MSQEAAGIQIMIPNIMMEEVIAMLIPYPGGLLKRTVNTAVESK